jgi:hypothetical protein
MLISDRSSCMLSLLMDIRRQKKSNVYIEYDAILKHYDMATGGYFYGLIERKIIEETRCLLNSSLGES